MEKGKPDGKPRSDYHLMRSQGRDGPIFRQLGVTIDLDGGETHNRFGFQSARSEPCNRSTTSPLFINHAQYG